MPAARASCRSRFARPRVEGVLGCCRSLCLSLRAVRREVPPMADGVFFNRAPELGRLRQVLGSPPTSVLVLTGPPSCGKSGAYLRPALC